MSDRFDEPRGPWPRLGGSTILQIVPELREGPNARSALNLARMLLQCGARALVAGREGPLVNDLKAYGGEWIPFKPDSINPLTRRHNDNLLERLVGSERIDIIHAQCIGGAASAWRTAEAVAVWLVTTFPDAPPPPPPFSPPPPPPPPPPP